MSSESGQLVNCRLRERCEGKREGKERRGKSRKRGGKGKEGRGGGKCEDPVSKNKAESKIKT